MIRGNHEQLLLELLYKSYPDGHDFSNHTVDTVCQLAGVDHYDITEYKTWQEDDNTFDYPKWSKDLWQECTEKAKNQ